MAAALFVFHLAALLAPWTFTWAGLLTAAVLVLVTSQFGVSLGYHRLLCHKSFDTAPWLRSLLALLGVLACQRGPLSWCAIHRLHHRHSDSDRDPQMSHAGLLRAHLLWAVADRPFGPATEQDVRGVTADLHRDPVLRNLERYFLAVNAFFALGLFLLGWVCGGAALAMSLVVWGFFLRVVYVWHVTFLVNSVSHRWGYRNYPSPDNSRNCWWVALLSFGEGWHNNHHHRPRCAAHGHRWFEIDTTYSVIRLLEWLGLARKVVHPPQLGR
jgi:stearoyl-CoA desaturase (delta-9 desaturase)